MQRFIARYRPLITGALSGFDRLVFRGTLLPLMRDGGMFFFLERAGVRLLDFKDFVTKASDRVKESAYAEAARRDRPIRYLESSGWDKEKIAKRVLAEPPIDRGLICVLTAVEPCMSFEYHRSPNRDERGLKLRPKKCLHLYKYVVHPQFGFMSARLQTWFPFNIQICLNGREWLGRQLRRRRSNFKRTDNCFPWLGNVELAQRLMHEQLQTDWPDALDAIARYLNPLHSEIFKAQPMEYYWSGYQTEWATDILFKDPRTLAGIYPPLVRHAIEHFKSPDVMRFLGGKVRAAPRRRRREFRVKSRGSLNSGLSTLNSRTTRPAASCASRPPSRGRKTSRSSGRPTMSPRASSNGARFGRVLRISIAVPSFPSAPTMRTSRPSPPWKTPLPARSSSMRSLAPSSPAIAASEPCA